LWGWPRGSGFVAHDRIPRILRRKSITVNERVVSSVRLHHIAHIAIVTTPLFVTVHTPC
jgi:hypothetical protein